MLKQRFIDSAPHCRRFRRLGRAGANQRRQRWRLARESSACRTWERGNIKGWNNCGPATLTNALAHFGYTDDQYRAANWLKPNYEDKNVSAWQMAEFVNTQIPELPVYALVRDGGTLELLQTLMVNGFPVVIEKGYEPPDYTWMGHYLLLAGYDEALSEVDTMDSFKGPNTRYSYDEIQEYWQHFNYKYIVLYTINRESELMALLGDDADEWQNQINALELARAEAIADQEDAHAWFNMGSSFVELGMYPAAAQAYDKAISLGLPWRMFWYQFGAWEAYFHTERYDDMIRIARDKTRMMAAVNTSKRPTTTWAWRARGGAK